MCTHLRYERLRLRSQLFTVVYITGDVFLLGFLKHAKIYIFEEYSCRKKCKRKEQYAPTYSLLLSPKLL